MKNLLVIKGEMTDLNAYTYQARGNKFASNTIKQEETERVMYDALEQKITRFEGKVNIYIRIFTKDTRKDEDNHFIYAKYILDGLKAAKVIKQDTPKYVHVAQCEVFFDGRGARVEVMIELC